MYALTSSGRDSRGAEVVDNPCEACGYYEEHFTDTGIAKIGKPCDRCRR